MFRQRLQLVQAIGRMSWRFHITSRIGRAGVAAPDLPMAELARGARRWQLAFNLMRSSQVAAGLPRRPLFAVRSIHKLRYELLHRAGLVLHPAGKPTLDVGTAAVVRQRFLAIDTRLPRAA
jgi:hypothetical protein